MPSQQLDLKSAFSILEEVEPHISELQRAIDQHNATVQAGDGSLSSLASGFRGRYQLTQETNSLLEKCNQAISLAKQVKEGTPSLKIEVKRDGNAMTLDAAAIIGFAQFDKGLIKYVSGKFDEAQAHFERSLKECPTPHAQLRLAMAFLAQGERGKSLRALQEVIDHYPEEDEAVEARKILLDVQKLEPRFWNVALGLSLFLGWLGADRFYLGYYKDGFLKLITFGGLTLWWLVDIIRISMNSLRDANGCRLE